MIGNNLIIGTMSETTFTAIAATRSQEIQSGADTIEIANPSSGQWRQFMAGRKQWSVNVNYLVRGDANTNIRDVLKVGTTYTLCIKDREGNFSIQGSAICTQCKVTSVISNIVSGSFAFQGTGALM